MTALNQGSQQGFMRPDGSHISCDRPRPTVVQIAHSQRIKADVGVLKRSLSGEIADSSAIDKIARDSSTDNFEARKYAVCETYGNGGLTPKEYGDLISRLISPTSPKAGPPSPPLVPETEARVDSDVEPGAFIKYSDHTRVPLAIRLRAVSTNNLEAGNVIFALIVVHNEDMLPAGFQSKPSSRSCKEVPSCIGWQLWNQVENPIIVRGGDTAGSSLSWTVDVKKGAKAIHVYWETYQREADAGNKCVVDESRQGPKGGIPFLKVVDASGKTVTGAECYRSYGDKAVVM